MRRVCGDKNLGEGIKEELNERHRKTLNRRTPKEVFEKFILKNGRGFYKLTKKKSILPWSILMLALTMPTNENSEHIKVRRCG